METAKKIRIAILIVLIVCAAVFMTLKLTGRIGISEDEISDIYVVNYKDKAEELLGTRVSVDGISTVSNDDIPSLHTGLVYLDDRTEGEYFIYYKPKGIYFGWHLLKEGKITKDDKIKEFDCGEYGTAYVSLNYNYMINAIKYTDGRAIDPEDVGKENTYYDIKYVIAENSMKPIVFYDKDGKEIETEMEEVL